MKIITIFRFFACTPPTFTIFTSFTPSLYQVIIKPMPDRHSGAEREDPKLFLIVKPCHHPPALYLQYENPEGLRQPDTGFSLAS